MLAKIIMICRNKNLNPTSSFYRSSKFSLHVLKFKKNRVLRVLIEYLTGLNRYSKLYILYNIHNSATTLYILCYNQLGQLPDHASILLIVYIFFTYLSPVQFNNSSNRIHISKDRLVRSVVAKYKRTKNFHRDKRCYGRKLEGLSSRYI